MTRDHGGNIDWAMARFGGAPGDWIDLSTGINRVPYPVGPLSPAAWTALPTRAAMDALCAAAGRAYATRAAIAPLAGAQAAIQMIPRLVHDRAAPIARPGDARVLSPTYNEHAAALRAAGWAVTDVTDPAQLSGADLAVIVNPNNPDGRALSPQMIKGLAGQVGLLVVDESFADARPDLSVAPLAGTRKGLFVLRSFGKFYGLAGLRLGFALGHPEDIAPLAEAAGPWPITGAAIEIGTRALADTSWHDATVARLADEVPRIDAAAAALGWTCAGGTALFRLYRTGGALAAQEELARARIWSRAFPWSERLIRLGLPGTPQEWARLTAALAGPRSG